MSRSQADEISESNLGLREVKLVYLITYSHADTRKVPSRQRFAEIVLEAFFSRLHDIRMNEDFIEWKDWLCFSYKL